MVTDHPGENAALIQHFLEQRSKVIAKDLTSAPSADQVIIFSDKTTLSLEKFADNPRRKRATVTVHDQASFADYVNAQKINAVTALFGCVTESGGSFSGIIDYHANVTVPVVGGGANWGEHRVTLPLAFTPEWKRWIANDGKALTQVEFAEFVQDNLPDIVTPAAADLLEVVQDLIAKKSVSFRSTQRLDNGQTGLLYDEQIQTNKREGQIEVPHEFTISIAPFVGSPAVGITARLRFRIADGGALFFIYKLNQPHKVVEAAFDSARSYIAQKTEIPVLLGSAKVDGIPTA